MRACIPLSRATPQMRHFAKRLIAHETLRTKSSEENFPAAFHVLERLRPHLASLMGKDGFRALLSRALTLANAEVSWLRSVHVNAEGTLEGYGELHSQLGPAEFLEDTIVLLAQLLGLLTAFIGPGLTLRLIEEIWPEISLNNVDLVHGEKNEKSN